MHTSLVAVFQLHYGQLMAFINAAKVVTGQLKNYLQVLVKRCIYVGNDTWLENQHKEKTSFIRSLGVCEDRMGLGHWLGLILCVSFIALTLIVA